MRPLILLLAAVSALMTAAADDPAPGQPTAEPPPITTKRTVYGTIRGTVVGPIGKPLQGIMVQLIARDESGTLRVTGTDEKGQYAFTDLPAGVYDVEVATGSGGRTRKERVAVKPPFRNIVDFRVAAAGDAMPLTGVGDLFAKWPGLEGPGGPGAGGGPAAGSVPVTGAEPAGTVVPVRGTLLDSRKQPATEAVVTLIAHTGAGIFQAMSGDDGTFLIETVPVGRYRLRVTSPGHVVLDVASIEVGPGGGMTLNLALVDYPLAAGDRRAEIPPREVPRALPPAP
jgi:hypothetical protein